MNADELREKVLSRIERYDDFSDVITITIATVVEECAVILDDYSDQKTEEFDTYTTKDMADHARNAAVKSVAASELADRIRALVPKIEYTQP